MEIAMVNNQKEGQTMNQRWMGPVIGLVAGVVGIIGMVVTAGPAYAGLEDILYKKGMITKEEWAKAKAETAQTKAELEQAKAEAAQAKAELAKVKADTDKAVAPVKDLDDWKKKVEKLAILSDRFNIGLNVLQVQFLANEAESEAGGNSDNRFFIRRAELVAWGKVSDYLPRWHLLADFASRTNNTANTTTATASDILKEAYVDIVPALSLQPYINKVRVGQDRIPVGIEGSTTSALIDFVNRSYITQAGGATTAVGTFPSGVSGTASAGVSGTVDFLQERDLLVSVQSKPLEQLELDLGLMNGNNINGVGAATDNNDQKDFFGRTRIKPRKDLFVSFSTIQGTSNGVNSRNGGRGKGAFDRYLADFQFKPEFIPGLHLQGEFAWGHDAPPVGSTTPGAAGFNTVTTGKGELRTAWYVYGKYLIQSGLLKDIELLTRHEQFDPSQNTSQDMMFRTTFGINYWFANLPPKVQAKLMLNYELRNRGGFGPLGGVRDSDEFGHDALLLQFHVRWF